MESPSLQSTKRSTSPYWPFSSPHFHRHCIFSWKNKSKVWRGRRGKLYSEIRRLEKGEFYPVLYLVGKVPPCPDRPCLNWHLFQEGRPQSENLWHFLFIYYRSLIIFFFFSLFCISFESIHLDLNIHLCTTIHQLGWRNKIFIFSFSFYQLAISDIYVFGLHFFCINPN